jgi:3-oxoacyl-[acyl-carrier protein] reductase
VATTDPAEMRRVVAVHAIAPFVLSKAALPHLRAAGRGDIIMISSVATLLMSANGAPTAWARARRRRWLAPSQSRNASTAFAATSSLPA